MVCGSHLGSGDLSPDGLRRCTRSAATVPASTTTLTQPSRQRKLGEFVEEEHTVMCQRSRMSLDAS
jgi:hypothetical protein